MVTSLWNVFPVIRSTFFVEGVEGAFDVVVEVVGAAEACWHVEFVVVLVVGVGYHEHACRVWIVFFGWDVDPVWQVVSVGVRFPEEVFPFPCKLHAPTHDSSSSIFRSTILSEALHMSS